MPEKTSKEELTRRLNDALGWEIRAQLMYAHYAAYVTGIHRLHLKPYFEGESAESVSHAVVVRDEIVKLGGVARTERDAAEIVHSSNYRSMLDEAMKTETHAAQSYKRFLELPGIDPELFDAIEQVYFQEERSVAELKQVIDE